jgi:hypothetical protein
MGRQIGSLLLAATIAMSMASCGGDRAGPVDQARPQITRASLLARGDAICRRDQAQVSARLSQLPRHGRSARIEAVILPILKLNEQAIRAGAQRIEALGTPSSGADVLDAYIRERTKAAGALRTAISAARKNETGKLEAALKRYRRNGAQSAATLFGFKVCGLGAGEVTPVTDS